MVVLHVRDQHYPNRCFNSPSTRSVFTALTSFIAGAAKLLGMIRNLWQKWMPGLPSSNPDPNNWPNVAICAPSLPP